MPYKITDTTIVDQSRNVSNIGVATFAGPLIVGSGTSSGTALQVLQVTGNNGAYVGGNLGIGTTNPSTKLSVIGNSNISGVLTSGVLVASKDPGTGALADYTNSTFGNGWLLSAPANTTYYRLAILPVGNTGNTFDHINITGVLGGWTNDNQTPFDITFSNRGSFDYKYISYGTIRSDVRILGISTNNTLEVWAQHQASAFTKLVYNINHSIDATVFSNPTSTTVAPTGSTVFDSSTTLPRFIINESDNVGIGTIAPTSRLHVLGDVVVSGTGVTSGNYITQKSYTTNNGTLSWEGSAGQLFSITNNLTSGSIFSVNDVSGIPSIDVDANGTIEIAPFGGNVGVGTTSPSTKLDVNGVTKSTSYSVSNVFDVLSATLTTTSASQAVLSSLTAASYASVEYTIQAVRGTSIHTTKILLIEDGTTASITEYGTVTNGSNLATYDADVSAGNVRLLVTPSSATSTKFQVAITAIKV